MPAEMSKSVVEYEARCSNPGKSKISVLLFGGLQRRSEACVHLRMGALSMAELRGSSGRDAMMSSITVKFTGFEARKDYL